MTLEETKLLAIASINMVNKDMKGSEHIKISQIKADTKQFEILDGTTNFWVDGIGNKKISC